MKKYILLIVTGLFVINFSFSKDLFKNTKTDKHKQVDGTKIFLIPPYGFEKADNFQGFQQKSTASTIMATEINTPYNEEINGLTELGVFNILIVKKKQEIQINEYSGLYITAEQTVSGIKYLKQIIVIGDDKITLIINGIYQEDKTILEKPITDSIFSVFYDTDIK